MDDKIVALDHVWAHYEQMPVLEDVHLHLKPLDFVSIIGPNGGGKTTLLKVMLGLLKPTQGRIEIFGKAPTESRQHIGYVPQQATLDKQFPINVWDATIMGRMGHTPPFKRFSARDRDLTADALHKVKMYDLRHRPVGKISGGQQQRVLIARALVAQPKLLLLDEPTASVDAEIKRDLYELLQELNTQITIVMVSHDIGVISRYVKTIACLNRRLIYHDEKGVTPEMLAATYQCPVDLIAHGIPHRVLTPHE